jgi:exopolysaccharide biosynthesis predicted pyruvyltransferase EpsI
MAKRVLTEENQKHIDECVFPPVTAWLRGFIDADFIVTDSFHGSIFSILFNKPFLAIGNKKRGMERFNSLMKMFGLEERLIYSPEELTDEIIDAPVDWKRVNSIRSDKKECAINFLSNNLKR